MNIDELNDLFNITTCIKSRSITVKIKYLTNYIDWCIENNIEYARSDIHQFKYDVSESIKRVSVKNPLHLQICLDGVFDPEDDNTIDNTFRAFFWFAYSGIKEMDTMFIEDCNVDITNRIIIYNNEKYRIYEEGVKAIRKCMELKSFVKKYPNRRNSVLDRGDCNLLLRGFSKSCNLLTFRSKVSIKIKGGEYSTFLSYNKVLLSGFYYRMYQMELAGKEIDYKEIARSIAFVKNADKDKNEERFKSNEGLIVSDLKRDYSAWRRSLL